MQVFQHNLTKGMEDTLLKFKKHYKSTNKDKSGIWITETNEIIFRATKSCQR